MLLLWEFSRVPLKFIDQQLKQRGHLYHAYLAVELAERTFDEANPPYTKLKTSRKPRSLVDEMGHGQSRLVAELLAAKKKRAEELGKLQPHIIPWLFQFPVPHCECLVSVGDRIILRY